MAFVKVATLQELPAGTGKQVTVNGKKIALFNLGGSVAPAGFQFNQGTIAFNSSVGQPLAVLIGSIANSGSATMNSTVTSGTAPAG